MRWVWLWKARGLLMVPDDRDVPRDSMQVAAAVWMLAVAVLLTTCSPRTPPPDSLSRSPQATLTPEIPSRIRADYRQVAPRDAIRPIYQPTFVPGHAADLDPGELVMGVEVAGEAKAYPVGFLEFRELVNDEVGGTPVLVTWCPLCRTGLVFDRRLDGSPVVFGNQGDLYKNALTMWDHATGSVWWQVSGEALYGPLRGDRLEQVVAAVETWAAWAETHPDTLVLDVPEGAIPEIPGDMFLIGVEVGGEAVGFWFPHVVARGVVNDTVGGVPVAVYADEDQVIRVYARRIDNRVRRLQLDGRALVDEDTGARWDARTGATLEGSGDPVDLERLPWTSAYERAWSDFHPDARVVGDG